MRAGKKCVKSFKIRGEKDTRTRSKEKNSREQEREYERGEKRRIGKSKIECVIN